MASIKNLKGTIIHRHDTAINWQKNAPNFVPKKGELIIFDADIDESGNLVTTGYDGAGVTVEPSEEVRLKIGDGNKNIIELPYIEGFDEQELQEYLDLNEYIKNTDYATKDKGGTVKINPNYGLKMIFGSLMGTTKTGNSYTKADDDCLISKGTLKPLLDNKQNKLTPSNGISIDEENNIYVTNPIEGISSDEHNIDITKRINITTDTFEAFIDDRGINWKDSSHSIHLGSNTEFVDINTIDVGNATIKNVAAPEDDNDAINKKYFDDYIAHTVALNGKKEITASTYAIIDDIATVDHLEIHCENGPSQLVVASGDEFVKYKGTHNGTDSPYVLVTLYDGNNVPSKNGTTYFNSGYIYLESVNENDIIGGVKINPNGDDLYVFITLDSVKTVKDEFGDAMHDEWNYTTYTIDKSDAEEFLASIDVRTGDYTINTSSITNDGTLRMFQLVSGVVFNYSIKYLQKSNIENSIGDRSLTQTFDPGYTYVKIASKNPLVGELGLDLTDTTPMGATGEYAASFGGVSAALGKRSFACGTNTVAKGKYSLASGDNAIAYGNESFTSGYNTLAKGVQTAAFGYKSAAIGPQAFVMGNGCIAGGPQSFAGGQMSKTVDTALRSFAFGDHCRADYNDQFVVGRYNSPLSVNTLFAVGTGAANALNTMFEVGTYGAYVDGQRVVTTVDLSNSESKTNKKINEKIKGINDTLDKTTEEDTVVHIDNILNTKSVKIDSTVTENYFFSKDYIKTVKTVNVTTSFYASSINIYTENISIDEFSVKTPEWGDTGYRYLLLRTGQNYDGSNSILTIGINQYNTEILIDALLPSNQYMLIIKQDSTGYTFLHMFDYTHRVDWVKGTSLENLPYPDCYVVVHKSQINQSRGRITASWSKCGQYEVLENRIKVIEKDLSTLIKFFKDSDTDGVLPPFTLGG